LPYRRQIRRIVAKRSSRTGGGDDGENHRDLGHKLHPALDLHLDVERDLDAILDLNNGGKLPFLLSSSSFCNNTSCLTISYDMQIRSARISIRIGCG
jgi:hypothetical protein